MRPHSFQLCFSNGTWRVTLRPRLSFSGDLKITFLYKMGGASPPYSSFSPLILGPFLKPKDVTFIHLSPIQLMRTKILLEIVLGLGGAR